jgi:hypothetical protein
VSAAAGACSGPGGWRRCAAGVLHVGGCHRRVVAWLVGHELAVGGSRCGEVVVSFGELEFGVGGLLLEVVDLLVEGVDAGWGAEPGLAPGLLAEHLGKAAFQLLDAGAEPDRAFLRGELGSQPGPGDRGACVVAGGGRGGFEGAWPASSGR